MNISEVAKLVGLSSKQIRDYEKSGLLKPAQRSLSGYRHYEEKGFGAITFYSSLSRCRIFLQQIHQLLQLQDNPKRSSREVKALTTQHIKTLNEQIHHFKKNGRGIRTMA